MLAKVESATVSRGADRSVLMLACPAATMVSCMLAPSSAVIAQRYARKKAARRKHEALPMLAWLAAAR
jgi:hypothetical protein